MPKARTPLDMERIEALQRQESREMLGLTDNLRYNGLHHSSATQTRRVPVCVSNFNSSCAAMRVRKRPSPM